jgi:hypothetical protein
MNFSLNFCSDIENIIKSYLPYNFPDYVLNLKPGLHIISSDKNKMVFKLLELYESYDIILFTPYKKKYKKYKIKIIDNNFYDNFQLCILNAQSNFIKKNKKNLIFIDSIPINILKTFSLSGIIFHGSTFIIPVFLKVKKWADIIFPYRMLYNTWITDEYNLLLNEDDEDYKRIKKSGLYLVKEFNDREIYLLRTNMLYEHIQ